jgi:hypothetical protein
MAPVPVSLRLINTDDPYRRQVLMSMDKVPPTTWQRSADYTDKSQHREFIKSGDSSINTFDLADGQHTLYVAVGMDESKGLGAWSGVGDIGGVVRPIDRVDFDTLAKFVFTVKGGKVLDSSKPTKTGTVKPGLGGLVFNTGPSSTIDKPQGEPVATRAGAEAGNTSQKVSNMFESALEWMKQNKVATIASSATVAIVVGGVFWAKKKKRY